MTREGRVAAGCWAATGVRSSSGLHWSPTCGRIWSRNSGNVARLYCSCGSPICADSTAHNRAGKKTPHMDKIHWQSVRGREHAAAVWRKTSFDTAGRCGCLTHNMICQSGSWWSGIDTEYWRATQAWGRASIGGTSSLEGSPSRLPCSLPAANWSSTSSDTGALAVMGSSSVGWTAPFGLLGDEPRAWVRGESVRTRFYVLALHSSTVSLRSCFFSFWLFARCFTFYIWTMFHW